MGSDREDSPTRPKLGLRRSPRGGNKLALVWTFVGIFFLAAGIYYYNNEASVRQFTRSAGTGVSERLASKVTRRITSLEGEKGTVRSDLERAELIYSRNLERRKAEYGPNLGGQFLGKGEVFQYFQPIYPCVAEERVGSWKDGGKWLCDVPSLGPHSVVYSIGSYELTDFEEALYDLTSAEIHVFDHTLDDAQQKRMKANKKFHYHAIGLGGAVAEGKLLPLVTIMDTLKHGCVDVLKIDCEGCEFSVFPAIFQAFEGKTPPFGQIQLEVHEYHQSWDNIRDLLTLIEGRGYRMFNYDVNWECDQCMEVAFIHESVLRPGQQVT